MEIEWVDTQGWLPGFVCSVERDELPESGAFSVGEGDYE